MRNLLWLLLKLLQGFDLLLHVCDLLVQCHILFDLFLYFLVNRIQTAFLEFLLT